MQLGWSLPLVLDTHGKRAFETFNGFDYILSNLPPDNPLLRCVPHLELAARDLRGRDNFKLGDWHEVPDFQLALANNGQGRRLHSANADDPARAPAENDGRGAGE